MEVALPNGGAKKHVEEWSRLDALTGMLEHARVESDHWATKTSNSTHHFGKVVDSRAQNLADGSVQQKRQTKQLELFQAHIPGGSVQVIKSHTSTSSSWHNSKVIHGHSSDWPSENERLKNGINNMSSDDFNNFADCRNRVNLNSEKTKATVARSISNRRPPTRNRALKQENAPAVGENNRISVTDLSSESMRICNELHENAKNNFFALEAKQSNNLLTNGFHKQRAIISARDSKRSTSDEHLSTRDELLLENSVTGDDSSSEDWKRASKLRWSLQYPSSSSKSKKQIAACDFHNSDNEKTELQLVLEKVLNHKKSHDQPDDPLNENFIIKPTTVVKRPSFVTEQTLKETKNKLRHLRNDDDEIDDGIDSEGVKEDGFDGENQEVRINNNGTGSLESRNSHKSNSNCRVKSDEWYNRRKSYGFEQVYSPHPDIPKSAHKIDSSTDSGICRSTEIVTIPISDTNQPNFEESSPPKYTTHFKGGKTVVTVENGASAAADDFPSKGGKIFDTIKKLCEKSQNFNSQKFSDQVTIPVSVTSNRKFNINETCLKDKETTDDDFSKEFSPLKSPKFLQSPTTTVRIQNDSSDQDISSGGDKKPPKKVEFCKTEIHFAAEPGRINIVETDEKPPSNNLYRRRRKYTTENKRNNGNLPETKFGDSNYERNLLIANNNNNYYYSSPKFGRGSENEENGVTTTDNEHDEIGGHFENPPKSYNNFGQNSDLTKYNVFIPKLEKISRVPVGSNQSTTTDNGLAVRISSNIAPIDFRRASWSVSEQPPGEVQAKVAAGYSTKINFGDKGATVVTSDSAELSNRMRHSICVPSESVWKVPTNECGGGGDEEEIRWQRLPPEMCREKLIVRIGTDCYSKDDKQYIQKPTFCHSFRNSVHTAAVDMTTKSLSTLSQITKSSSSSSSLSDQLKSASLIMQTVRNTTKTIRQHNQNNSHNNISSINVITNAIKQMNLFDDNNNNNNNSDNRTIDKKCKNFILEQPSTYITEMNKLQHKYATTANDSRKRLKYSISAPPIYNTIPKINLSKSNSLQKSSSRSILPSVLSDFDDLSRHIDQEILIQQPSKNEHSKFSKLVKNVSTFVHENVCMGKRIIVHDNNNNYTNRFKQQQSNNNNYEFDCNRNESNKKQSEETKLSSQLLFLNNNELIDDHADEERMSEDSLKADEEVRSYMSNEYIDDAQDDNTDDNNYHHSNYYYYGSHKLIKPLTIIKKENSGKLHNVSKQNKDVYHHQAQPTTVKQCKTTAVTVGFNRIGFKTDKHFQPIKAPSTTTELIRQKNHQIQYNHHALPKIRTEFNKGKYAAESYASGKSSLEINYENLKNSSKNQTTTKIIYHKITNDNSDDVNNNSNSKSRQQACLEKETFGRRHASLEKDALRRLEIPPPPTKNRIIINSNNKKDINGGSIRSNGSISRKKIPINYDKDKLFNSGRDGWLNIPKERKPIGAKSSSSSSSNVVIKDQQQMDTGRKRYYKNAENNNYKKIANRNSETDQDLMLELTKAADEILLAVGGYTDTAESAGITSEEESKKSSSSNKNHSAKPLLSTIIEKPVKKQSNGCSKYSQLSTMTNSKCSNSAAERCSTNLDETNGMKIEDRSKRRAARMLHRACSREMLLQTNAASSSEDIASDNDKYISKTKPKFVRKSKTIKSKSDDQTPNNPTISMNTKRVSGSSTNSYIKSTGRHHNYTNEITSESSPDWNCYHA